MAESIGERRWELGRAKVYQKLGIALKDVNGQAITATEGMLRLSDAVAGMSKEEAIFPYQRAWHHGQPHGGVDSRAAKKWSACWLFKKSSPA